MLAAKVEAVGQPVDLERHAFLERHLEYAVEVDSGLRSEGNALVIELDGPASALSFRRRRKRKAPTPRMARPPTPAAHTGLRYK